MEPDEPRRKAAMVMTVGEDLSDISVADLRDRISYLESEIARAQAELEKKQSHEAAANALFKS